MKDHIDQAYRCARTLLSAVHLFCDLRLILARDGPDRVIPAIADALQEIFNGSERLGALVRPLNFHLRRLYPPGSPPVSAARGEVVESTWLQATSSVSDHVMVMLENANILIAPTVFCAPSGRGPA